MTLISCPTCGHQVSSAAALCPNCGHPLKPPSAPPAPRSEPTLTPGTTKAVRVFFFIAAGASALAAIGQFNFASVLGEWIGNPLNLVTVDEVTEAEDSARALAALANLAGLTLVILLMVWGNRAYHHGVRRGATGGTWGPGWAIGGWFIPLANLVIPKLVLNEIDRMSHPDNGLPTVANQWRSMRVVPAGIGWWLLTVAGVVMLGVGGYLREDAMDSVFSPGWETFRSGVIATGVGMGLIAVGQFIGAFYVKALRPRFHPES